MIGYLGCSNTQMAVQGYRALGGRRIWNAYNCNGGTLLVWAGISTSALYWSRFDARFATYPDIDDADSPPASQPGDARLRGEHGHEEQAQDSQ
jgi:hypothetical protein